MTESPSSSPLRVLASRSALPLHDIAATRRIEALALANTAPHALMARAGLAVARLALAVAPHAQRIGVLAGPGNNGGDGLLAALHLHRLGRQVQVLHLADSARCPADAADALQQARQGGVTIVNDPSAMVSADLWIDALLGLGAARAPQGAIAQAISAANACGAPILAIDLPSGLQADSGGLLGEVAIRARWTLSQLTLKPGLFTAQGRDLAGEVWFDRLGVAPGEPAIAWLGACPAAPAPGFAPRRHAQHKGSFGDLFVVGGATGMQGAAWLAAHAALTAGAGRVYLSLLGSDSTAPAWSELMQFKQVWQADPKLLQRATVVCGCGGGSEVAAALPALLDHAGRLLLDADALNAIAGDAVLQARLQARSARGSPTVLTPHPLEAARLLGSSTATVQADRLGSADALVNRYGAVVLLKGSGTVISAPQQPPWINSSGNAMLAAPGSGDVLAGWIGGLWAQQSDAGIGGAWFAARAAAWLHGHAVDVLLAARPAQGQLPMRAGDLIDAMAAAIS